MYNSQHLQDKFLNENVFKNKRNGVFLDIGANDGIAINNTLFFEKELEWTGICVEPIPEIFNKLEKNRNCICINGCINDVTMSDKFLKIDGYPQMLSGLMSKYDKRHLQRIDYEIQVFGGSKTIIDVNCYSLNELLEKYNITDIDYCSLDIEGGEFEVLKTINFDKINIKSFSVENNYMSSNIKKFLKTKDYILFEALECDEIYLKKEFLETINNQ